MENLLTYAEEQYAFVRDARNVLMTYCKTIANRDFLKEHGSFGRGGSIRNILVHIANTYEFWIGKWGLKKDQIFTEYGTKQTIEDVIDLFDNIDLLVFEFIRLLGRPDFNEIYFEINGVKNTVKSLQVFSHVITHEFHHKGQILSLSRHWGYTPVDTDIMR